MKIELLNRQQIDEAKWNMCIEQSGFDRVNAQVWYLDIVAKGWQALVLNDYDAVMPMAIKQRWGIRYITLPDWSQQLGIFSRVVLHSDTIHLFYQRIPYVFRHLQVNSRPNPDKTMACSQQLPNCELMLCHDKATLMHQFSQNTKRNVRKSAACELSMPLENHANEFLVFMDQWARFECSPKQRELLRQIITDAIARDCGWIVKACSQTGEVLAMVFFLKSKTRIIYHTSVSSPQGYDSCATYAIVNHIIRQYAGSGLILDFEGSRIDGIKRFFEGFGAVDCPYYSLKPVMNFSFVRKLIRGISRF